MTLALDIAGCLLLLVMTAALWMVHPWAAVAVAAGLLGAVCLALAARRDVSRETEASE